MKNPASWFSSLPLALIVISTLLVCYSPIVSAQKKPPRKATQAVVKQGICGVVRVKRGNYMPSPDSPQQNPSGTPVEREVLIFPLLNRSQVEAGEHGFINSVGDVKPVKVVRSRNDGTFCVSLPVGRYTVMVREEKGLYANLSDSRNNLFPVNVQKNKSITVTIDITHQAVF